MAPDLQLRGRVDRHRERLACPSCHGPISETATGLACAACPREFPVKDGAPWLRVDPPQQVEDEYFEGARGWIRSRPKLYRWVMRCCAPVLITGPDPVEAFAGSGSGPIIDVGAGNDRRHPDFLTVDLLRYPEVDIVGNAAQLPFADDSVAGVVSITVLEHVEDPGAVLREAHRVLSPGGRLFLVVPMVVPYHSAPLDFRRWTHEGVVEELEQAGDFEIVDRGVYTGPASALAWYLAEWLALAVTFGVSRLRAVVSPVLQILLSPIKLLDYLLARLPGATDLAATLFVVAEKRPSEVST